MPALSGTAPTPIGSYVGVPLSDKDGVVFGALCALCALCALGHQPHTSLNSRDLDMLIGLAEVVAPLVQALDEPPAPSSSTGLASAYLTIVHEDDGVQEIRYARNTRTDFEIPEGLVVPWEDTLCKRALDEGRPVMTDVPAVWGDSDAARSLGIQVYASVPVATSDGKVWGTLCAADSMVADDVATHLPTMRLFARLIAAQVEGEGAAHRAQEEASTDPLTHCSTRRVVEPWLAVQLGALTSDDVVVVAFADLDKFKQINDTWGHAAGDAVLVQV